MDAEQAQQKAKSILEEEGIDILLVKLFLAVRHYPSWVAHEDFDTKRNFGVTCIQSSLFNMKVGYKDKPVKMVLGEFNGAKFRIGGDSRYIDYPDGGGAVFAVIQLGFGNDLKTVVEAEFTTNFDPCSPKDYKLFAVEELHYSTDWIDFLRSTSQAIDAQEKKRELIRSQEQNEKYAGKFTF